MPLLKSNLLRTNLQQITPVKISAALGLPVSRLFEIAEAAEKHYRPTRVTKTESGKLRELDVPKPFLKCLLRKLHRFIQKSLLFSSAAHGGVRGYPKSRFTRQVDI
ncbi:MAG: hypothetical protein SFV23_01405 [Planctomycetaceae bacterium]|nr:hypothetical protein [Planctomycetaceae bacterium]